MPVPSTIADLSTVAADNYPQGSESIGTNLDDYIRAGFAITKQVYALMGQLAGTNTWTGPQTYSGAVTFSSTGTHNGTETFNQPAIFANGIGLGGASYGAVGQVPVSAGAGVAASWKYPFIVPFISVYSSSATMTASNLGSFSYFTGSSTGQVITLPLASSGSSGSSISFQNIGSVPVTIQRQGADGINCVFGSVLSVVVSPFETIVIVTDGSSAWAQLSYSSSRVINCVRVSTAGSGAAGYGTTNTKIRRFTTIEKNVGSSITYADSATLGPTFTINTAGVYSISYSDTFTTACTAGISVNATSYLSTNIGSIPVANNLGEDSNIANNPCCVSVTIPLSAGDVIRPHTDGIYTGINHGQSFTITRIS